MDGRRHFPQQYNAFYSDPYVYPAPIPLPQNNTSSGMFSCSPYSAYSNPLATSQVGMAASESSIDQNSSPEGESSTVATKRVYEKWTNDEQKLLVNLWAENLYRIESKDSRKVWDSIADQVNKTFKASRSRRSTDKFQKKIKYLVDRYKQVKDWNTKQSGGHRRKSIFYDEIDEVLGCRDIVTLQHVEEAGSSHSAASSTSTNPSSPSHSDEDETAQATNKARKKRGERKKRRKNVTKEEEDDEERKLLRSAVTGLEGQREEMSSFVQNFNRIQGEQLNTMNSLVGALTKFLEKQ